MDSAAASAPLLRSVMCKENDLTSPAFLAWAARLKERPGRLHRKVWEFCFIVQALAERNLLREGCRGLGFGVGKEPLVSLFAGMGCEVVASDIDEEHARQAGWTATNQHSTDLSHLNRRGLCDPDLFQRRARFRHVDMNAIPADLRGFDFVWSSCSLEHLGSISHGERFILESIRCLRPGGVAVHTTEYNLSSNRTTLDNLGTVLFRRRDLERIARQLQIQGHRIDLDLTPGTTPADQHVDVPPYSPDLHLRMRLQQFTTTSVGLIIERGTRTPSRSATLRQWMLGLDPLMIRSRVSRVTVLPARRMAGRIKRALLGARRQG